MPFVVLWLWSRQSDNALLTAQYSPSDLESTYVERVKLSPSEGRGRLVENRDPLHALEARASRPAKRHFGLAVPLRLVGRMSSA